MSLQPRTRLGKGRPPMTQPELRVDYKDVLDQALENQRFKILRDITERVEKVATRKSDPFSYTYRPEPRSADEVKDDVKRILRDMEVEQ